MKSNKKSSNCCRIFFEWFLQILLICSLISIIISATRDPRDFTSLIIITGPIFGVLYIINLCVNLCCSPTYQYLSHKHKTNSINEYMEKLFYSCPEFHLRCQCYHYEYRRSHHSSNNHSTNIHGGRRTTRTRVNTYFDEKEFKYASWLDISGLFTLANEDLHGKSYIKLELDLEFNFADNMTTYDFDYLKSNMKNHARMMDQHMDYTEKVQIRGFEEYNLINCGNNDPASKGAYIFFTLIGAVQFYKMYFESKCSDQKFTLKKVVSSRYNLFNTELGSKYAADSPRVNYQNVETRFDNAPQKVEKYYDLPSEEEIKNSEIFNTNNQGGQPIMRCNTNSNIQTFQQDENQNPSQNYNPNQNLQDKLI